MSPPIVNNDDRRRATKDCCWFVAIEKRAVLAEVSTFGALHFDKTTCLPIIRKLLYLLNQGETFTKSEAEAVLRSAINLYGFEDIYLRRMFCLIAKELCPVADEVGNVIGTLYKDTTSKNVFYRANAIRLLCGITKGPCPTQIEAFLKEAIQDPNPMVKSVALVCAINLFNLKSNRMICFKLIEQFGEVVQSQANLVQFHALCLLFRMLRDDLRGVEYLVRLYTKGICNKRLIFSSPLSQCLLARGINKVTRAMHVSVEEYPSYYTYLRSCIYHGDIMVALQGFGSFEELNNIRTSELSLAIDVLRPFLRSPEPVVRFGAFRALYKVRDVNWSSSEEHAALMEDANMGKYLCSSSNTVDREYDTCNKEPMPHLVPQVLKSQSNFAKNEATAAAPYNNHDLRKRFLSLNIHKGVKE